MAVDTFVIFFAISVSRTGDTDRRNIFSSDIRSSPVKVFERIFSSKFALLVDDATSCLKRAMSVAYLSLQTVRISGNLIEASIGVMIFDGSATVLRNFMLFAFLENFIGRL